MKTLQCNNALKFAALAAVLAPATLARAKCDEWMPMFDGPNGRVSAMLAFDNTLIVGGSFESCGAADPDGAMRFIARFDGRDWTSLAGGTSGGGVFALAQHGGELIAGGSFTRAGGVPAYGIARFNGREWLPVGQGMSADGDEQSAVLAITEFNGDLIAAGTFTTAGDAQAAYIARWDGASWSSLGNGMDSPVFALAVLKDRLIAGGENFIRSWDGESWTNFGGDPQPIGTVRTLLVREGQLFAGGRFVGPLGGTHHGVLQTDGSQWSTVGNEIQEDFDAGAFGDIHALMMYQGDLIASGEMEADGSSFIARFNGTFWLTLGAPSGGSASGGRSDGSHALAIYINALTAAGDFEVDDTTTSYVGFWTDCSPLQFADVNGDGSVDITDMLLVLGHYGVCPETTET
jgi:hypothetical protein